MKKWIAVLLLFLSLGVSACGGEAPPAGTAATYQGEPIRKSVVAEQKKVAGGDVSDREIIDRIITNLIMLEEAEKRGLTATEEEVETFLAENVYAAYEMPEGKH